jgi:hypothetical protein
MALGDGRDVDSMYSLSEDGMHTGLAITRTVIHSIAVLK